MSEQIMVEQALNLKLTGEHIEHMYNICKKARQYTNEDPVLTNESNNFANDIMVFIDEEIDDDN